jgi:hypothetical protein
MKKIKRLALFGFVLLLMFFTVSAQEGEKKTKGPHIVHPRPNYDFSELPSNWSLELSTFPFVQLVKNDDISDMTALIGRSNDIEIKYRVSKKTLISDILTLGAKADYDNLKDWDRYSFNAGYGKELHIGFHRIHGSIGAQALLNFTKFDVMESAYSVQALGYGSLEVFLSKRVTITARYNYLAGVNLQTFKEVAGEIINKDSDLKSQISRALYIKIGFYI